MSKAQVEPVQQDLRLRVFLCHCSSDKPVVRNLYHRLQADGYDPWLDQENLLPGQNWRTEIPLAVQNSHAVVVLLSGKSINKEGYLQKEINEALSVAEEKPEGTIFIIPVRLEDVKVPRRLENWQWADLFDKHGYERLLFALSARARQLGLMNGSIATNEVLESRVWEQGPKVTHNVAEGGEQQQPPHEKTESEAGAGIVGHGRKSGDSRGRIWIASATAVTMITLLTILTWRHFNPVSDHYASDNIWREGLTYLNGESNGLARIDQAINAFEKAVKFDRYYAKPYASLGEAYFLRFAATGQPEWRAKAEAACKQSQRLDSNLPDAPNCFGALHAGTGQYDDAIKDFSQAIKADPQNAKSFVGRAKAYQGRAAEDSDQGHDAAKDLQAAESDYLHAIDLDHDNWRNYKSLAAFYHEQGCDLDAIFQYQNAIARKKDNAKLYASLGALYIETGRYDEAIKVLKGQASEHSFAIYENLGTAYLDKHDFQEAIVNFEAARDHNQNSYQVHGNLARAYFWARRQEAQQEYQQAIKLAKEQVKLNANDTDANLSLSIYYAMLGDSASAGLYLKRARGSETNNPEVRFWATIVELQLGHKQKALDLLPDAIGYSPSEVKAAPELDGLRNDPQFERAIAAATSQANSRCSYKKESK